MNNKILILVYIPVIEMELDFYIPINRKIGTIKKAIVNYVNETYELELEKDRKILICDKVTGQIFDEKSVIKNSNISNGSKLLFL